MKYSIIFSLIACSLLATSSSVDDASVEDKGITATTILSGLKVPWEIAWGPDNRIWYTEQDGTVTTFDLVTQKKKLLLRLRDLYRYNLGLLSMAIHPDFRNKPYVFFNYTYLQPDSVIRSKVVRYTFINDTLLSPIVLLDIPANRGHNGSRMIIAPDGKLMIATGDIDMNNDSRNGGNAQNINTTGGKILRIDIDGKIPADNPYPNNPLWARGFRVPQGLAYGRTGNLYSCEHGNDQDDEINLIKKDGNYGYPYVLGKCDAPNEMEFCRQHNILPPINAWTPTIAPSGIDYYNSDAIPSWKNSILVATLKNQSLHVLTLGDSGTTVVSEKIYFEKKFGRLRDICVSPSGDVYISTSNRDWNPAPGFPISSDDRIIKLTLSRNTSASEEAVVTPSKSNPKQTTLYVNYCGSCHKENGEGVKGIFPSLVGSKVVSGKKVNLLRKVIHGIRVEGQSPEKYDAQMSPFRFLKNEELATILSYTRKKFGNGAGPVSIAEIQRVKSEVNP